MNLKNEIWGCMKYIGFTLEELNNMPTRDRRIYIKKHNHDQQKNERIFANSITQSDRRRRKA